MKKWELLIWIYSRQLGHIQTYYILIKQNSINSGILHSYQLTLKYLFYIKNKYHNSFRDFIIIYFLSTTKFRPKQLMAHC